MSVGAFTESDIMRKWNLPLTYEPKIQPVIDGECTQTIRAITISKSKKHPGKLIKKEVGDLVRFYRWTGRPYWSSPLYITEYMPLIEVLDLTVFNGGIEFPSSLGGRDFAMWNDLDKLAERDGIVPPKGFVLRNVLLSKNKIPLNGLVCQILRWTP
jgi:hypothetical protein